MVTWTYWTARRRGLSDLEIGDAVPHVVAHTEKSLAWIKILNHGKRTDESSLPMPTWCIVRDEIPSFGALPYLTCHLRPAGHQLLLRNTTAPIARQFRLRSASLTA